MYSKATFESVFQEQLAELHDAEQQILEGMPQMIHAASSPELKTAFELHLAETKEHLARLETILAASRGPKTRALSDAMRALLAKTRLGAIRRRQCPALDAALIGAAQQIEHYEIGSYGAARQLARMLKHEHAAQLLNRTLKEEQETVSQLAQIAETLIMGPDLEDALVEEEAAV